MNKKIVFISDFFVDQVTGGAEIYDDILIKELSERKIKVAKFNSHEFTTKHLNLYIKTGFNFIISNFTNLPDNVKKSFEVYGSRYVIIEHDHKYLVGRDPSNYVNFKAPQGRIINRSFYASAKNVFCQSIKHAEVLSDNLKIDNVINLECSLWSKEQIEILRSLTDQEKNDKCFVLGDANPIKGSKEAKKYCDDKQFKNCTS